MADKNPISNWGKKIVTTMKDLGLFIEIYESPEGVCRQCRTPTAYEFCSEACGLDYWKNFKEHHYKSSGHRICGYPGCSNPCFVERERTHDYCGRKHANEHSAMQDRRRQHRPQQPCSGHHGNSHQSDSPSQNTRSQSGHSSWWRWSNKPATGPINFYNRDDPYYEFTNFYSAPIKIDKKTWPTSEHYFQAQKFVGTPYEERIRHLPWPRQAFDFTRDPKVSCWRRNDWESIKDQIMYKALLAKFTQHDDLRKLLLETKERKLVERSPYDSYWGDGGDGTGKNRLGELLMRLRRELRSGQNSKKGATHIQQEVTSEHFQHSSPQSGQGREWKPSDNTPRSSENGNWNCQASHTGLLRQPLHPTDPAYQQSNSGGNIVSANPPHQQGSAMLVADLNPPTSAVNTAQQSFDGNQQPPDQPASNSSGAVSSKVDLSSYQQVPQHLATSASSQHNQMPQQRRDSATHDEKMDFTEAGDAGEQGQ